jgi:hypothetical protein
MDKREDMADEKLTTSTRDRDALLEPSGRGS